MSEEQMRNMARTMASAPESATPMQVPEYSPESEQWQDDDAEDVEDVEEVQAE
jgi:hypothetical protein